MPLTSITASQRSQCQRSASQLKRPMPCPGLLPIPIPVPPSYSGPPCPGVLGEYACGRAAIQVSRSFFVLSRSNFKVPPGYVGVTFQQYSGAVVPMTSIARWTARTLRVHVGKDIVRSSGKWLAARRIAGADILRTTDDLKPTPRQRRHRQALPILRYRMRAGRLSAHHGSPTSHGPGTCPRLAYARISIPADLDPAATYRILFACSRVEGGDMGGLLCRHVGSYRNA